MHSTPSSPSADAPLGPPSGLPRRTLLKGLAGVAAANFLSVRSAAAGARKPRPSGKPGDFDFLSGNWKIQNRRKKGESWDEFEGEATVYGILNGLVSVEELRIPTRNFSGMGLRLLNPETKLWADYFVNSKTCVIGGEPAWGSFVDGVGVWDSDDKDGEKPIIVRGCWDRITPKSCRWFQAVTHDDGKTWEENWVMQWTRV